MRAVVLFAALATLALPAQLSAQDPQPTSIQVTWPADQPHAKTGKIAVYRGEADQVGVKFAIPAGSVLSPSAVVVKVTDGSGPLKVGLRNDLSNQWDRQVTTDAKGMAEIRFRTEGSAMLLVQSAQAGARTKFEVAFFQGKELPAKNRRPPFLSPKDFAAKTGAAATSATAGATTAPGEQSKVMWVIAGLLGVLVLIGGAILMRKSR